MTSDSNHQLSIQQFRDLLKRQCIALTGGIATGKTALATELTKLGFLVIDADQLARDVVMPGRATLQTIVSKFGNDLLTADGHLDRAMLRTKVMPDQNQRRELELIMHPAIAEEFQQRVSTARPSNYFFYEAALIYEVNRQQDFYQVWTTYCSESEQLKRLMARSKLSVHDASMMINSQLDGLKKAQMADVSFNTEVPIDDLRMRLMQLTASLPNISSAGFLKVFD